MAETTRTQTHTQIRNLYSDGLSYLNISFYNTYLSFKFYPFLSTTSTGRNTFDTNKGQNTTVNFEGAYLLYQTSKDILDKKVQELLVTIDCASDTKLTLERKIAISGEPETILSINKNGTIIPFKFKTITRQIKENGQVLTEQVEVGLGAFMKTIEGYLTGINADRHLNKLTDDYVKSLNGDNQTPNQNNQFQNNYNNKKNYSNTSRKPYNANYRRNYNNNQNQWNPPRQQNISEYQITE